MADQVATPTPAKPDMSAGLKKLLDDAKSARDGANPDTKARLDGLVDQAQKLHDAATGKS